MTRHDGSVDPLDAEEVGGVVTSVANSMGPGGVVDLLGRLPGAVLRPEVPKRFLSAGSPETVFLGEQHALAVIGTVLEYQHVVGGVVLHRDRLTPAELGPKLAVLIDQLVRVMNCVEEASVVLTGARDAVAGF